MKLLTCLLAVAALTLAGPVAAQAAYLVQIDTDGLDDGPIAFNPNFSFGGDTTTASSSARSNAPLLPEGDSLFGGDGVNDLDTYVFSYDPAVDADNLVTANTFLGVDTVGNNVQGTGVTGGGVGSYRVYAAWPLTTNVSGGDTSYAVDSSSDSFTTIVNQNSANVHTNGEGWVLLGAVNYDGLGTIVVTQSAGSNTFVSMRSAAVLFEPVPEPASILLTLLAAAGLVTRRRTK